MQLLGSDIIQNNLSKSPWLFESKSYEVPVKGGGKKKSKSKTKTKANRRKSAKNKTRRRIYN